MEKTFGFFSKFLGCFGGLAFLIPCAFAETTLVAEMNRATTSLDESVLFSVELSTDENGKVGDGEPTFDSPDFDILSTQEGQTSRTMITTSGLRLSLTLQRSYILRPKRTGVLTIRSIQWKSGGRSFSAPNVTIHVTPSGQGTAPPPRYGGAGAGMRGAGKPSNARSFFIRADVSAQSPYVGQQVIVSYYLFQRVVVSSPEMKKYPALEGFLKEELEMPIIRSGLKDFQMVVVDGVSYRRSLLMRYAAYPLKAGPAKVDSTTMTARYFSQADSFGSQFGNLFQMFGMGSQQEQTVSSEPITLQVRELPPASSDSFKGGVGEFSIDSAADKTELKTGDALQLIVKIEGRGNLSSIEAPKVEWPGGFESYDVKATSKSTGGYGQRVFTYTVVPKKPGEFQVPGVTATWFNPSLEKYESKTADGFRVRVTGAEIPTAQAPPPDPVLQPQGTLKKADQVVLAPLPPGSLGEFSAWREKLGNALCVGAILFLGLLSVILWVDIRGADSARRERLRKAAARESQLAWTALASRASKLKASSEPFDRVIEAYSDLETAILDAVQKLSGLSSRGLARVDLGLLLTNERGVRRDLWLKIEKVLEYCETTRFILTTRVYPESDARSRYESWVHEAERAIQELEIELRPKA